MVEGTFLTSGLIYLIISKIKPKIKYKDVYNIHTYSMIPFMATILLFFEEGIIFWVFPIYSLILMIIGMSKIHNISKIKSALICLFSAILIFYINFIMFFYFVFGVLNVPL
jgi:hypothetical protein